MKLKIFIIAFISLLAVSFPANIIGCGPDADPYDYYTSFFHQELPDAKGFRPFYYTSYNFLYEENEPFLPADILAKEWASYCGGAVTEKDAKEFVTVYDLKDVNAIYNNIEKSKPLSVPDSIMQNSMTKYFMQQKDLEGLGYIIYAKKAEPHVTGEVTAWEPLVRDSVAMSKLIKNGQQLYAVAKKDIFKLKYGYQVLRLAHYSKRYNDAINFYDQYIATNKTNSILQPLSLAIKAGALTRTGKQQEAALLFSKLFIENDVKRISNYLSFMWSRNSMISKESYLQVCKNNADKAAMLTLFALTEGLQNEVPTIKNIYDIDPSSKALEVLIVREINKLEETYYTPLLQNKKGGAAYYFHYGQQGVVDPVKRDAAKELAEFLDMAAQKKQVANPGLCEVGAAYLYLMIQEYKNSKKCIDAAEKIKLTSKVKDQLALTKLLLAVNETENIDASFEEKILPGIKWLQHKAQTEATIKVSYSDVQQWKSFYRNLMCEVLAKRYHQQGQLFKEVLLIGSADRIYDAGDGYAGNSINFLHDKLESKDVEELYSLLTKKDRTAFEDYLINFNVLKKNDVIDFAGTAYLRDFNYQKAIEWFKKGDDAKFFCETDPFIELLYDQEAALPNEKGMSKLSFANEMLKLEQQAEKDKAAAAKHYYKMALGLYNITYYGHAWKLVQYDRSGSDGYYIPKDANAFQKEYYGCVKAHDVFKKAMEATADKNLKAKCLFMMAKCSQKQIRQPQYSDFPDNYDKYDEAGKKYWELFKYNKYFPELVKEYSNTAFYKEAFNSCSYLRDFVEKK